MIIYFQTIQLIEKIYTLCYTKGNIYRVVVSLAYTFDEIMAFHPDNEDVYREIKQFLPKLVPFIGAGLTRFAYCLWPKALKTLS